MPPKCATVRLHERVELLGIGEVARDRQRLPALGFDQRDGLSDRADESSVRLDRAGGDDDLRAVPGEGQRELPTDAAAGAGHDCHSIEELHVETRRITAAGVRLTRGGPSTSVAGA